MKTKENSNVEVSTSKMLLHRFIFILIFAIIAVCITFFLIQKNKPEEILEDESEAIIVEENVEEVKNEKTLDLNATYDLNQLVINTYTLENSKYEYIQIDGLKDESIEIKINQEIKNGVEEIISKYSENYPDSEINVYSNVTANFANVLSIYVDISSSSSDEYHYELKTFNFDLNTGKRLKLSDFFSSKISVKDLLVDKLYESIASENVYMDDDGWLRIADDAEDIEESVYAIVSKYLTNQNFEFYFTPQILVICEDNIYCKIYFGDYIDYITIYDKFAGGDLYDGKYEAKKDIPTLIDTTRFHEAVYGIEEESDNYYIRINLYDYSEASEEVLETIKDYMDEFTQEFKDEANESGIFKIYDGSMWVSENLGTYEAYGTIYQCDTTKSNYTEVIKEKILEIYREDMTEWGEGGTGEFVYSVTNDYETIEKSIEVDNIGNILVEEEEETIIDTID